MSYPSYPEYKSSHVEWLKEVPCHWTLKPLWALFRRVKDTGHPLEELLSVYREFGVIPKASRDDNYNKPSEDLSGYQLVHNGDLAINKMKAWQGSVAISEYRGIVSPAYYVYRRHHSERSRFLHYLFRSKEYTSAYLSRSKGIRVNQWDLDPQEHSRMDVLLPPLDEQAQIARFLDHQTARIDALIAEQQRLIELLKEKRQAVISHAVTKGLDPDVTMKDSGVEWLGEVPEHWTVCLLKRNLESADYGISDSLEMDGDIPVLRMGNISEGKVVGDNLKYTDSVPSELILKPGDLLFNRTNSLDLIGKVGLYEGDPKGPTSFASYLVRLRLLNHSSPHYFSYLLNTTNILSIAQANALVAIGQCNLNPARYGEIKVAVPPLEEQHQISEYLGSKVGIVDSLIGNSRQGIELLKERRSALTSATVAGKIDVRDWEPPVSETFPQSTASEEAPA